MQRFKDGTYQPTGLWLPAEVWEKIIDILNGVEEEEIRIRTLASCCLFRRDCLPRSRHHLFRHITLRSLTNLHGLSEALANHPQYGACVESLAVEGPGYCDSRISAGVAVLILRMTNLQELVLYDFDLRSMQFPRTTPASPFSNPLKVLRLCRPLYSSYTQALHLMTMTACREAHITDTSDSLSFSDLDSAPAQYTYNTPGSLPFLRRLNLELPLLKAESVGHLLLEAIPWQSLERLEFITIRLQVPDSVDVSEAFDFRDVWEDIVEVFQSVVSHWRSVFKCLVVHVGEKYRVMLEALSCEFKYLKIRHSLNQSIQRNEKEMPAEMCVWALGTRMTTISASASWPMSSPLCPSRR